MKRSKFTEQQIAFALQQTESETQVAEVCRKMGIAEATSPSSWSLGAPCTSWTQREFLWYGRRLGVPPKFMTAVIVCQVRTIWPFPVRAPGGSERRSRPRGLPR